MNYLGHFIIIVKLLPIMRHSGDDCRILLMSSDAHRSCSFDLNTMNYEGNPTRFGRLDYYGRSKLYQVHFVCKTTPLYILLCTRGAVNTVVDNETTYAV